MVGSSKSAKAPVIVPVYSTMQMQLSIEVTGLDDIEPSARSYITILVDEYCYYDMEYIHFYLRKRWTKPQFKGFCTYPTLERPTYHIHCSIGVGGWPCRFRRRKKHELTPKFLDIGEVAVFLLSHELHHYLAHSRRVPTPNLEGHCDWFAYERLREFRSMRLRLLEVEKAKANQQVQRLLHKLDM